MDGTIAMAKHIPAIIALEDGTIWHGLGFGAIGETTGEVVFNTSITGYQEILTDPSYHGQLVTMTQPHIGNYGVTPEDDESDQIWASGFIIRQLSPVVSNWRSRQSLEDYLAERNIIGITDVDTRALVRHIREHGAMRGVIASGDAATGENIEAELIEKAKNSRDMNGADLVKEVTCTEAYNWTEAQDWWEPETAGKVENSKEFNVVAYDFGIKRNILRLLASRGCDITVVPASTPASEVLAMNPDGIFRKKPMFGICLGHQILGLALGGETYKMKFGHRGGNQPVQVETSGSVQISSHNHGFAIDANSLPEGITASHINLNDQCCEGLVAPALNAFSVQYHPESSPGPHDSDELFDKFIQSIKDSK